MAKKKPYNKNKGGRTAKDERDERQDTRSNPRQSQGSSRNSSDNKRDDKDNKGKEVRTASGALVKSVYSNDPKWYDRAGNLTELATNISTATQIGVNYPTFGLHEYTPVGILRLDYIPCFGDIEGATHPINVIGQHLYDNVNAMNSRTDRYDPNDLMLYVVAIGSLITIHSWVRRLIGMFNTFSRANRYWWDAVCESMNVAEIDVSNGINEWVELANYMAIMMNTLPVPADITYYSRCRLLPEYIYADSMTEKCTLYYYNPAKLFKLAHDSEGKGKLTSVNFVNANSVLRNVDPSDVKDLFLDLFSALRDESDFKYMKADIRNAFADSELYSIPQLDAHYEQGFVYDGFMNLQTRNATIMDFLGPYHGAYSYLYEVYQDMTTNTLVSNRAITHITDHIDEFKKDTSIWQLHNTQYMPHIFDFPLDTVTNDMWSEATKLHAYFSYSQRLRATSEVLVRDKWFSFELDNQGIAQLVSYISCVNAGLIEFNGDPQDMNAYNFSEFRKKIQAATKCAAAPLSWVVPGESVEGHRNYFDSTIDLDLTLNDDLTNFVTVPVTNLDKIRDAAQMSVFTWKDLK